MNLSNVIQRKVKNMSRNYAFNNNVIKKQSLKCCQISDRNKICHKSSHSQSFTLSGKWLQEWATN